MNNCKICGTSTNNKMKNVPICKKCRIDVTQKRNDMKALYKEKEVAFVANPADTKLIGELTSIKRGSINEAIEELTKE